MKSTVFFIVVTFLISLFNVNVFAANDKSSPVIIAINPVSGSEVDIGLELTVKFDENIHKGDTFSKIGLIDSKGKKVLIGVSIYNNLLKIKPKTSLTYATAFELTIPAGAVKDRSGNVLKKAVVVKFKTSKKPEIKLTSTVAPTSTPTLSSTYTPTSTVAPTPTPDPTPTPTPNLYAVFSNRNLEMIVRAAISKPTGKILKSEMEKIEVLKYEDGKVFSNLTANKYVNIEGVEGLPNLDGIYSLINLKSLYIRVDSQVDILALSALPKLQNLSISTNMAVSVHDPSSRLKNINVIGNLVNLKSLDLSDNNLADINFLSTLNKLEELNLTNNRIANIGLFGKLNNLQKLHLGCNELKDIRILGNLINLKELDLFMNTVEDIDFSKNLKNLVLLDIGENQIKNLEPLRALKNLEYLYADHNKIEDASILADLKNIKGYNISYNPVKKGIAVGSQLDIFLGDINGNNTVTSEDLSILKEYLEKKRWFSFREFVAADVTEDLKVEKDDLQRLTEMISDKEKPRKAVIPSYCTQEGIQQTILVPENKPTTIQTDMYTIFSKGVGAGLLLGHFHFFEAEIVESTNSFIISDNYGLIRIRQGFGRPGVSGLAVLYYKFKDIEYKQSICSLDKNYWANVEKNCIDNTADTVEEFEKILEKYYYEQDVPQFLESNMQWAYIKVNFDVIKEIVRPEFLSSDLSYYTWNGFFERQSKADSQSEENLKVLRDLWVIRVLYSDDYYYLGFYINKR